MPAAAAVAGAAAAGFVPVAAVAAEGAAAARRSVWRDGRVQPGWGRALRWAGGAHRREADPATRDRYGAAVSRFPRHYQPTSLPLTWHVLQPMTVRSYHAAFRSWIDRAIGMEAFRDLRIASGGFDLFHAKYSAGIFICQSIAPARRGLILEAHVG